MPRAVGKPDDGGIRMIDPPPRSTRRGTELSRSIARDPAFLKVRPALVEGPTAKHLAGAIVRGQIGGDKRRAIRRLIDRNRRPRAAALSIDHLFPRLSVVGGAPYRRIEGNTRKDPAVTAGGKKQIPVPIPDKTRLAPLGFISRHRNERNRTPAVRPMPPARHPGNSEFPHLRHHHIE